MTPKSEHVVIYIKSCDKYVEEVDPRTRTTTGTPKQFLRTPDDDGGYYLEPLPRDKWTLHPTRIVVDSWSI